MIKYLEFYLDHFDLTDRPFQINTDASMLWLGEKHKEALATLKYGIYENHVSSAQAGMFSAFFYTEESIYIDAVNSRLYFEGSLFARALGVSGNPIFYDDESAQQINGIIVNSYRGYINGSGSAVPSTSDDANGFYIEKIDSANYQDRFYNIPVFESLIHNPGTYIFDKSEWYIE